MWHDYPYTDLNELNLDWFLKEFKAYYEKTVEQDQKITTLEETVEQFTNFVTNYFDNLDVQQEINNKLDAMAASGELQAMLQPYFDGFVEAVNDQITTQNNRINTLDARMDEFARLSEGSTTGDAELMDIRVGANGVKYADAGTAVRSQVDQINSALKQNNPESNDYISIFDGFAEVQNGYKALVSGGNVGRNAVTGVNFVSIPIGNIGDGILIKYTNLTTLATAASNLVIFADKGTIVELPASYGYLSKNNIEVGWNNVARYDSVSGLAYISKAAFTTLYASTAFVFVNILDADEIYNVTWHDNRSVYDITSGICASHNLIGNEAGVYYPVDIPAGSTLKVTTYRGQAMTNSIQVYLYNAEKTQVDYFGLVAGAIGRTYAIPAARGAISYVGLNVASDIPIQLELTNVTDFEFYQITSKLVSDKFKELDNAIENISPSDDNLPAFVVSAGNDAYRRIMTWADDDEFAMIAQVTDLHSAETMKYKAAGYLNDLNHLFGFDIIGNFGDIGLDTPSETLDNAWALVMDTKRLQDATSPWIFMRGNHDHGRVARFTNQNLSNFFEMPSAKQHPEINASGECYGYIDLNDRQLRVIYLNTSDDKYYGGYDIKVAQLEWLVDTLESVTAGWNVVILSHMDVDASGRWNSYPTDADGDNFDTLRSIMEGFVAKTSGSNVGTGVSWDFTAVDAGCKLVCSFAGDSHFNNMAVTNGVRYITRQGYGGISDAEMPAGATKDPLNPTTQCLFDVLCIKNDGNAAVFRIGVGSPDRDIEFTY